MYMYLQRVVYTIIIAIRILTYVHYNVKQLLLFSVQNGCENQRNSNVYSGGFSHKKRI